MEFRGTRGEFYVKEGAIYSREVEKRIKNTPNYEYSITESDWEVAQCFADYFDGKIIPHEECEANAVLYAHALRMLEMLVRLKDKLANSDIPDYDDYDDICQLIESATKIN